MSVPRNVPVPSHSSSPSKSSLRRTSGSHNPSARSLLPSPHFDDPITAGSRESPRLEENIHGIEASQSQHDDGAQQQLLQPFFTLIEDAVTHEHFHPTVHYIFADDDADIITEAALRSLEQNQPDPEDSEARASRADPPPEDQGPDNRYLPRAKDGVKEHYIVLDVEPALSGLPAPAASTEGAGSGNVGGSTDARSQNAFDIVNAYSMSADWQVLRTGITKAPTMAEDEDEGLMLRIEGRTGTPPDAKLEGETMEEMIERFERGLEDVRLVLEAGRRMDAEAEEAQEALR